MTEQWRTADDLHAARERITADIAGWVPPAAHGTVLVTPDGTASLLAATAGGGLLSAAILARAVGYASGSRTVELSPDQVRRAVVDLTPAEAATHIQHPNIAAWRTLVSAFEFDPACRAYAVFVQDLSDETSSRYDEMLRATLADEGLAASGAHDAPHDTGVPKAAGAVIRPAAPADVAAVLAFWAVAAEDAHRPPDDEGAVATLIARDREALLLAWLDGVIVGSIVAGWDGWRAHLYRLAVHPAHRRRGLGSTLLTAAEERLSGLGARRFTAMVLDDNLDAHGLWTRAGYMPQQEWRRWVKPAPADPTA